MASWKENRQRRGWENLKQWTLRQPIVTVLSSRCLTNDLKRLSSLWFKQVPYVSRSLFLMEDNDNNVLVMSATTHTNALVQLTEQFSTLQISLARHFEEKRGQQVENCWRLIISLCLKCWSSYLIANCRGALGEISYTHASRGIERAANTR